MGMQKARARRTSLVAGLAVIAIGLAASTTAQADGGVNSDALQMSAQAPVGSAGISAVAYAALFAGVPSDPPTGTIVADSGFRPFPNGFSFVNYGNDLTSNQKYFGQPKPLGAGGKAAVALGLDTASMRRVFGDGVCVGGGAGGCVLTESAKVVQNTANTWAAAGRCFGLATLANALYTGKLSSSEVNGGAVNVLTTINVSAQRAIMRAFIAQYFSAVGIRPASMADAVNRLRAGISRGKIPFTVLIYGAAGGHALVPYAVLDKGAGKFDVAVYDPNLPNQARAMHIDTAANSWSYTGSPELAKSVWSSADAPKPAYFALGDVDSALAKQACVFCKTGRSGTLVAFSPVAAADGGVFSDITLKDATGKLLNPSSYRVILPTDAVGSPITSGPVVMVDPGIDFTVGLNAADATAVGPFTMSAFSEGSTRSLSFANLEELNASAVFIGAREGNMSVVAGGQNVATVRHTVEGTNVSYSFAGELRGAPHSDAMNMRTYTSFKRMYFRTLAVLPAQWSIRATSSVGKVSTTYESTEIWSVPGSRLILTYDKWAGRKGAPSLWLDKSADGSLDVKIPMHKV